MASLVWVASTVAVQSAQTGPHITQTSSDEEVVHAFLYHMREGKYGLAYDLLSPSQDTFYSANHLQETIDGNDKRPESWIFVQKAGPTVIIALVVHEDGSEDLASFYMLETDMGWRIDQFGFND